MIFFNRLHIKFGIIQKKNVDCNSWMLDNEIVESKKIQNLKRKNEFTGIRQLRNELLPKKEIIYSSSGKPSLIDDTTQLSISHSSQSICVAISDSPLGIDIEKIDDRILKVRAKFVNCEEKQFYAYDSIEDLTILWTIKESIYKLLDISGISFLDDIQIIERNRGEHTCLVQVNGMRITYTLKHEKINNEILTYNIN